MAETLDKHAVEDEGEAEEKADAATAVKSSSSSDSDAEDDADELRAESLAKSLAEKPSNFDAHVEYIQCLRKLGQIEKLREARKAMNELFPLNPTMWQEWAKDEASLSGSSEAFSTIKDIYEKGIKEYLSVSLWCDYINFVQENDQLVAQCAPSGVSEMRDLFERAVTAAGLHFAEGHNVWDAYREFEQAIYLTIDEESSEEREKQLSRIRALFHRQFAVPLRQLKSTIIAYKQWEAEQGNNSDIGSDDLGTLPANVASAYRKALVMCTARMPYEEQISKQDDSNVKLEAFMNYIKFEESCGDPARVQLMYERAVSEFPISGELWMGYTSYLDKTLKVPYVLKDVYSRAIKNCPWIGALWVHYLLSLERIHASESELAAVFERSLQCIFSSSDEYLDLFLTRVDGLRRRISITPVKEEGLEYDLIRETFQRAAEYLSPELARSDDILRLHVYWAKLEVNLGKDLVAARGVWESLLKKSAPLLEVWQAYINMETEMGHINEARSIYKRCYSKRFAGTGSEDICYSWLRFEREYGTLDDLDLATKKVIPRLDELRLFKTQQDSRNVPSLTGEKDNSNSSKTSSQKRKAPKISSESPAKRQKSAGKKSESRDAMRKDADMHDVEKDEQKDASTSNISIDGEGHHENQPESLRSRKSNQIIYTDQCTAFISNISLEANEEHLRKFFNGVTAIRLLKDKFTGRSRGLAYIDFSDQEHLSAAIAKNKQKLLGQKLSIVRSNPKQSKKKEAEHGCGGRTTSDSKGHVKRDDTNSSGRNNTVSHRRGGHIHLMGKNTFAVPRNLARPLGWTDKGKKTEEVEEQLTSNDEFRKKLLEK